MPTTLEPAARTGLRLYTVDDAAAAMGVSKSYLYKQIRENRITTVNLGSEDKRKLRIRAEDLAAYITERTTLAGAA